MLPIACLYTVVSIVAQSVATLLVITCVSCVLPALVLRWRAVAATSHTCGLVGFPGGLRLGRGSPFTGRGGLRCDHPQGCAHCLSHFAMSEDQPLFFSMEQGHVHGFDS